MMALFEAHWAYHFIVLVIEDVAVGLIHALYCYLVFIDDLDRNLVSVKQSLT